MMIAAARARPATAPRSRSSRRDRDVDPVGACVGMKGMRVQSIIRELRGEKIDIIEWSEDPVALRHQRDQPGEGQRVSIIDDAEQAMEVIVDDTQLSLAIGKKGQNVRLAAKLIGWKIDIKSEEEKRREVEVALGALELGEGAAPADAEVEAASEPADADQAGEIEASGSGAEAQAADSAAEPEAGAAEPDAEAEPPAGASGEDAEAK